MLCLDYRVAKEKNGPLFINPKDKYQDYRIFFKFSIRNGNCMSFIRDVTTGNELTNENVTKDGFIVDMANSKYLQVNIKKEVLSKGKNGLVEDTRFNKPVSDGEKFTDEGVYTLTTKNVYVVDISILRSINSKYRFIMAVSKEVNSHVKDKKFLREPAEIMEVWNKYDKEIRELKENLFYLLIKWKMDLIID